jgi:hypothetical protein
MCSEQEYRTCKTHPECDNTVNRNGLLVHVQSLCGMFLFHVISS